MARDKKQIELKDTEIVEVVMTKKCTYEHYKKMISEAKSKGWNIQAYQIGFLKNENKAI